MSFSVVPVTRWETFHWGETFLNDLCSLVIQVSPVSTVACLGFCPWPEEQPAWLRIRDCPTFLSDCCARYLSLCSGRACSNSSAFFRRNLESDVEWAEQRWWPGSQHADSGQEENQDVAQRHPDCHPDSWYVQPEAALLQRHPQGSTAACFLSLYILPSSQSFHKNLQSFKLYLSFPFTQGQGRSTRWNLTTKEKVYCQGTTSPMTTTLLLSSCLWAAEWWPNTKMGTRSGSMLAL